MNRHRVIVGLCMLCALLVSAFAAQGAAAATKGTTAFTCVEVAANTGEFNGAHCKTADKGSGIGYNWKHVAVAENTTTTFKSTNEKVGAKTNETVPATLKATIAGAPIELTSKAVDGSGGLENKKETEGTNIGEHYIQAHELKTTYTEVTENKAGCEVVGLPGGAGKIETKALTTTTTGQGDSGRLTPVSGTLFAEFELKNCVPKGTYKVVGSVTCKPDGATINCSHNEVTTSGTLHLGSAAGPVAGVEVSTTVLGGDKALGEPTTTPLSVTTIETP